LIKEFAKSAVRGLITRIRGQLEWWDREAQREHMERRDYDRDDLLTPWLTYQSERVLAIGEGKCRPSYTWPVVQAAHLAKALGRTRISIIEFGVAGGHGLLALERAAEIIESLFDVAIDVYGFDSGHGLPKPVDYRDLPHFWKESFYKMDEERLKPRLRRSHLVLGPVDETVPQFLTSKPAPVGFVSFDLDYYSSTTQAFKLLLAEHSLLMPRIYCYFDDIMGLTHSEFTGERLAIREFNETHTFKKITPIPGLRYLLPPQYSHDPWPDQMFLCHLFDHPMYTHSDKIHNERQRTMLDLEDE
jgi:hypothetical protein